MWSKRISICVTVAVVMAFSQPALAIQPIKVLLARTVGVSNFDAREMLEQINNLVDNSDLGFLGGFESASKSGGVPDVFVTSCGSSNLTALTTCAQSNLSTLRNDKNADIVLLMVVQDITNDCGGVPQGMINALTVSQLNEGLAFAVIERNCFNEQFNNQVVASHEVGHFLAIEHVDNDPAESLPALADANHAYENIYNNATAVASPGDCVPSCDWHNFFSDKDKDFSSAPLDDAGNSSDSNAVNVVSTLSWNVVASYRPYPGVQACNPSANFQFCVGEQSSYGISASLPGYNVTNADYDISFWGGGWEDVYEGVLICPNAAGTGEAIARAVLDTAYGQSQCEVFIVFANCGGGNPW